MGVAYNSKIVTDGLQLCLDAGNLKSYPGSGNTWTDLSGNGITGTLTNMEVPGDYSTTNGGALTFDGLDEFVKIINPTIFHNQNFTISAWINPGVQDNNIISLIDFEHSAGNAWVIQSENATGNRNYYLGWWTGSGFQPAGGFGNGIGIQITTSVWQNIVYSKNGTSLLGYSNGIQVFTPPTAGTSTVTYQNNKDVHIANCIINGGREFNGSISQVFIYNRALTATEIQQNYLATKSRYFS
jgi:hypothetical protein